MLFFTRICFLRRCRAALPVCLLLALTVAALAALSGCAQREGANNANNAPPATTPENNGAPAAPAGDFKVALATPGPTSDKGWNASALEGLQRIQKELGAQTSPPVESMALAQAAGVLRNLAQDGNQLLFIHGSEFDAAAQQVAADFPKTTFVVTGGRSVGPNLVPIQFAAGQATYLAGMLAAGMSKTGKIGLVGAAEIPIIQQAFASFEKGARAVNPNVRVTTTYTGDEKDPGKAKQQAQALLDAGADVLMHNANAAGQGVFQAVAETPGAMVIGANADQSDQATTHNLGSFILDVPSAMVSVARAVRDGTAAGKPFSAGLKDGAVDLKVNPGFEGTIPADLKAKIEQAKQDLIAGKVDPTP